MRLLFGPDQELYAALRTAAERHEGGRARVVVAWARDEGVRWLLDALGGRVLTLDVLVGLNEQGTTVDALLRLLRHSTSLRCFFKHPRQTFHPKLYWFTDGGDDLRRATLIVGSSNLTTGGVKTNYEASLVAEIGNGPLSAEDKALFHSVNAVWDGLVNSRFTRSIQTADDIQALYEERLIEPEAVVSRRRTQARRAGGAAPTTMPIMPPPRVHPPAAEVIVIPFPLREQPEPVEPAVEDADPPGEAPMPDRFFVRTLTQTDVNKLHGARGTFEPDLGETARDRFPAFWGWPEQYETVVRTLPRNEWRVEGRLITARTTARGVPITVTLWYRDARHGHAAEHRIGLSPIGQVREVMPQAFDTTSLMVVERAAPGAGYEFVIRLITQGEQGYPDYSTYLTEERPHHRFGYGP